MKKRQSSGDSAGSWLNTYADMVTLLLCFFVLLYAISNVDQIKWEILVKSMNPNYAKEVSQIVTNVDKQDGDFDVEGTFNRPSENAISTFDDLYYTLVEAAANMGLTEDDVQIQKSSSDGGEDSQSNAAAAAGISSTFITFQDKVFFKGDDSTLTENGKEILKKFSEILGQANDLIGEINILGHTSQGDPKKPNNIRTDFTLSALRSMEVIVYLASQKDVDTNKFVGEFYGQHKSVAAYDTAENRSKNRRVEILILRKGSETSKILDQYYDNFYKGDIRHTNFNIPDNKKIDKKSDKNNTDDTSNTEDMKSNSDTEVTDTEESSEVTD